jgi:hypothetical protein
MIDVNNFDQVFSFNPDISLSHQFSTEIANNRKFLRILFFDRLLGTLRIKGTYY